MTSSLSRALSLLVLAAAYVRAWWIPSGFWIVTLVSGPVLALTRSTPTRLVLLWRRWDGFSCCYLPCRFSWLTFRASEQTVRPLGTGGMAVTLAW